MAFSLLQLSEPILRSLKEEGYTTPTPIQAKAIPPILEGRDVLGCAQTGTGKTAAFALPILHKLMTMPVDKTRRGPAFPRALVLSPTRELAEQIGDSFATYGRHTGLVHTCVYGGVSQYHQVRALHRGVDILVATPGRLEDLMEQRVVNLSEVCVLVLDEADRMLDMGFIQPIRRIASALSNTKERPRHTLLFSATMPKEIMHLADSLLKDPVKVAVAAAPSAVPLITQSLYLVASKNEKQTLLHHLLNDKAVQRAVVFTKTKFGADRVSKKLRQAGIKADEIHGNKAQNQRQRALDAFRDGRTRVLVATDVAARGLDVDAITHVFNFDMPMEPESYVHRIGRTGRAGATGLAVSFCDKTERGLLRSVERLIGKQIPTVPVPKGMEYVDGSPEPIESFTQARGASASRGHSDRSPAGRGAPKGRGNDGGRDFTRPEPQRSSAQTPVKAPMPRAHAPNTSAVRGDSPAKAHERPHHTEKPAHAEKPAPAPKSSHAEKPSHAPAPRTPRMPMTDPIIEKPAKNYDYSGFERAEVGEAPVREPERITPVRPAYSEGPTHRPARTAPRPGGTGSGGTGFRPVSGDGPAKHAGAFRKEKPAFNSDKPAFNKGKPSFSKGKPVFGEDRSSRDERSDRADRPRFEGRSAAAPGFAPRKNFGPGGPARKDDRFDPRDKPRPAFARDGEGRGSAREAGPRFDPRGPAPSKFARDARPSGSDRGGFRPRRDDRMNEGGPARPASAPRDRDAFGPAPKHTAPRPMPGAKPSKTGLHASTHPHAAMPKTKAPTGKPGTGVMSAASAAAKASKKKSNKKPHRKGAPPARPFAGGGTGAKSKGH